MTFLKKISRLFTFFFEVVANFLFEVGRQFNSLSKQGFLKIFGFQYWQGRHMIINLPYFWPYNHKQALIEVCEIWLSQMRFCVEDHYFEQKDGFLIWSLSFCQNIFTNIWEIVHFLKTGAPKIVAKKSGWHFGYDKKHSLDKT